MMHSLRFLEWKVLLREEDFYRVTQCCVKTQIMCSPGSLGFNWPIRMNF